MPIQLSGKKSIYDDEQPDREFETVINLDEMAAAGVRGTIEIIEGEPPTAEAICECGHSEDTHDPCCVSACGCDGFEPRQPGQGVAMAADMISAKAVEDLFMAGVNRCMRENSDECPYSEGSLARHWETRGYAYQARAFRAVELKAQNGALCQQIAEMTKNNIRLHGKPSPLEARLEAIESALEDAGAPDATEAHALDNDPIIERIKLWRYAQDILVDTFEAQLAEATARAEAAEKKFQDERQHAEWLQGECDKAVDDMQQANSKKAKATKLIADLRNATIEECAKVAGAVSDSTPTEIERRIRKLKALNPDAPRSAQEGESE